MIDSSPKWTPECGVFATIILGHIPSNLSQSWPHWSSDSMTWELPWHLGPPVHEKKGTCLPNNTISLHSQVREFTSAGLVQLWTRNINTFFRFPLSCPLPWLFVSGAVFLITCTLAITQQVPHPPHELCTYLWDWVLNVLYSVILDDCGQ